MRTALNLVVRTNPDGSPFHESVLDEELGGSRFKVLASPGLLEGLAAGDEIELTAEEPTGFRVTRRGGNVCVQFFWNGDLKTCIQNLEPKAIALGGCMDGEAERELVFTIPIAAGFPAIERIFYEAQKQYAGCSWLYGNVYDPADGVTPLNWWVKPA